jgi:D-xylulose reductase
MQALILEETKRLRLGDIDIHQTLGPHDVRIAIRTVGICGSDIHYYQHGHIGPFVVQEPMVLGHEASGEVLETGRDVRTLKVGDRVCMEPGIPDPTSRAARLGLYNLDPAVRFWATPPVHGVLRPIVVHPEAYTYKLPDNVSLAEGAMVEPVAVGMHAAVKAHIAPGDIAVVTGAGPIGMVTALAAIASGVSRVILTDTLQPKLDLAAKLGPIVPVNAADRNAAQAVTDVTAGWGADIVFECSGSPRAASAVFDLVRPGGCVVFIGMPQEPIAYDVVRAQIKEARVEHVFRYANVYARTVELMSSGKIDVKPLITDRFDFSRSIEAFDFASDMPATSVKVQIELPEQP